MPWGALAGSGNRPVRAALLAAAGLLTCLLPAAALHGLRPGEALAAGAALAGFLLCLAGVSRATTRLAGRPAAGAAAAALAGCLALASFHLGDPFLEWGGTGAHSPAALAVLHAVNPLSGAVGDALALDFLRLRLFYSGFPGSLEGPLSAAQYYARPYFPFWGTALLHGGIGAALLVSSTAWTKTGRGSRSTSEPRSAP